MRCFLIAASFALVVTASPVGATEHLMVIQEVFVGPPEDEAEPNPTPDQRAQFVMLRMTFGLQTLMLDTYIRVEDKDGNELGRFGTFTADVLNGGLLCGYPNCPAILIGTQAARNMFTFNFDEIVDGQANRVALPAEGGRVCYVDPVAAPFPSPQVLDCVAWGSFDCSVSGDCKGGTSNRVRNGDDTTENGCDDDYGAPASMAGLQFGFAVARGNFSCAANENSTQFSNLFPHPVNNAGQNDNIDSDGDNLIDQLDCADADVNFQWPGARVTNTMEVHDSGPGVTNISWDDQTDTGGPGLTYDVVRGTLANVDGFTDAAAFDCNVVPNASADASMPAAGTGFYHMVRAGTGPAVCVGSYGDDSAGNPRNALDSAALCP